MTTTRFAPSPTGWLHIGNLRAALFNYAIARQNGGTFVLRIDDTDLERSKDEYIDGIKADLTWLGLTWDKIEHQSARMERYLEAKQRLIDMGRLYECFETPVELDLKRKKQLNMGKPPVYDRAALALSDADKDALRAERGGSHWRFKLDQERIDWTDGIIGDISIDAASVSDPVLFKNDGQILYTLASVVDDIELGMTHVVRGSDHVTNTATQIQIIQALGGAVPTFSHHSLLTGPQGQKLSKRDVDGLSLKDLRDQGIEPQAILSLMARLGSSDPVEVMGTVEGIVAGFDIAKFGSAPTKFDAEDLKPLTGRFIAMMDHTWAADAIAAAGVPADMAAPFWDVVKGNIHTLADLPGWWVLFNKGATPLVEDEDRGFIAQAFDLLGDPPYAADTWSTWTADVKEASGRKGKGLFMPLRKAVTGLERGPEMADVMPLLQTKPKV